MPPDRDALTDPATYTVERSALIAAPAGHIHEQIVDFRRWTAWSPWEDLDPDMQRSYSGSERGVGATYEWSGNRKAGAGRMEFSDVLPTRIVIGLQFRKPFKSTSTSTFSLAPDETGTRVTWTLAGPRTIAVKVMGLFTSMDKLMGGDFERGLRQLKAVCEAPSPEVSP